MEYITLHFLVVKPASIEATRFHSVGSNALSEFLVGNWTLGFRCSFTFVIMFMQKYVHQTRCANLNWGMPLCLKVGNHRLKAQLSLSWLLIIIGEISQGEPNTNGLPVKYMSDVYGSKISR